MENPKDGLTIAEIKQSFMDIFLYYSSFSNEENDLILQHINLYKFLNKINVKTNKNFFRKNSDVDILIKQIKKYGTYFLLWEFLNFLSLLSKKLFPKEFKDNPLIALKNFYLKYIQHFYMEITKEDKTSNLYFYQKILRKLNKININEELCLIFSNIYNTFSKIYSSYFKSEVSSKAKPEIIIKKSLLNLFEFLKDFEIMPYQIEKNKIVIIYNILVKDDVPNSNISDALFRNKKNYGQYFTFSKFYSLIIILSMLFFSKIKKFIAEEQYKSVDIPEKILIFLDKVNMGKGMNNFKKRFCLFSNTYLCLMPSKDIIEKINKVIIQTQSQPEIIDENISKEIQSNGEELMKYKNQLISMFKEFCQTGDALYSNKMSIGGFLNFLYKIGLLKERKLINSSSQRALSPTSRISTKKFMRTGSQKDINSPSKINSSETEFNPKDATIVYKQLTKNNEKFLDFDLFIKSFEYLSNKLSPKNIDMDQREKYQYFLNNFIYKFIPEFDNPNQNDIQNIQQIYNRIRDTNISSVIDDLSNILYSIYTTYSDENNWIDFNKFFTFTKDFSLFPDIINLVQIKNTFYSLCEILQLEIKEEMNDTQEIKVKENKKIINFLEGNFLNFEFFSVSLGIFSFNLKMSKNYDEREELIKFFQLLRYISQKFNIQKALKNNQSNLPVFKEFYNQVEILSKKYLGDSIFYEDTENKTDFKNIISSPNGFDKIYKEK